MCVCAAYESVCECESVCVCLCKYTCVGQLDRFV